jgi:formyltetrahydrofolate-dependent phosphoribosylglycinamide formyltransferase
MTPRARLAVLVSGSGTNLQAILDATGDGRLAAEVVLVVSNVPHVRALDRAAAVSVPTAVLERLPGEARPDYDTRLAALVVDARPDWVVLAGWMRILSMSFLGRFPNRVVNLHPALPGELAGTHAIERAHAEAEAGVRTRTGVMVHLVPDEGVDDGPVLATAEVPIHAGESLDDLAARVHATEHTLLVSTLATLVSTKEDVHA